ncbi:hypothetical protein D8M04_09170 [Oceanobacillus piezotolerans]|uniref:Uncharacterized protein n=1 Tax=Oceanobacillus piezotolerans TaxID=2448030 RepID=A0A498DBC2_9BACI|nr:hypothetical protein [Oceanobacillus piezotolerans]RLL45033.1 hypothetical protein D8M04_09170 [Oceanobacillus piezotolerans]
MRYLTEEELHIASRFLFLSMAIVVIKQDVAHIQNGAFKIKDPYIELLQRMESNALNERRKLRKTMEDKKLKVVQLNKNDSFSSYLFTCNGYEEKRNYFNPAIRKHVQAIYEELMELSLQSSQPAAVAKA